MIGTKANNGKPIRCITLSVFKSPSIDLISLLFIVNPYDCIVMPVASFLLSSSSIQRVIRTDLVGLFVTKVSRKCSAIIVVENKLL